MTYIFEKKKRKALNPGFTYGSMERSIEPLFFFFDQWPHSERTFIILKGVTGVIYEDEIKGKKTN